MDSGLDSAAVAASLLQELQLRARSEAAAELAAVRSAAAAEIAAVREEAAAAAAAATESAAAAIAAVRAEAAAAIAAVHKASFFIKLDSVAASASEKSESDVSRRGAPEPTIVPAADLFTKFPAVEDSDVAAAWEAYRRSHKSFYVAGARFHEVLHVQPVISALIRHAGGSVTRLREFKGKAPDEIGRHEINPDHTLTSERDMLPNLFGAAIIGEDKLPCDIGRALSQTLKYGRRRIRVVTREADARGEPLHTISAMLFGSDGRHIIFAKMMSGAPEDGNFATAMPCPCEASEALPLLVDWDFKSTGWIPPAVAPAGFAALVRLVRAPLSSFDTNGIALMGITVTIGGGDASTFDLRLGNRIGSGGTSDVYDVIVSEAVQAAIIAELPTDSGAAPPFTTISDGDGSLSTVVKLARYSSAAVEKQFAREATVLQLLSSSFSDETAAGPLVPRLVFSGLRTGVVTALLHPSFPSVVAAADAAGNDSLLRHSGWPFLLLSPRGEPVGDYLLHALSDLSGGAGGGGAGGAAAVSDRLRIADTLTSDLLLALHAAHKHSLIHCDVRTKNVVVFNGHAVLCDWGLCADAKENVVGWGVAAYCDTESVTQASYSARPRLDLIAVAYFWVSVAFGGSSCEAPWAQTGDLSLEMIGRRDSWFRDHVALSEPLQRCVEYIAAAKKAGNTQLIPALYVWPWSM